MILDLILVFLISLSPFGEARVGIPYGVLNDVPIFWSFLFGWVGNMLIFPLLYMAINYMNQWFWKYKKYKKGAVYVSKRAKNKTKSSIVKYGAWGLMVFVMVPLPITGAYLGTIAAYILKMNRNVALIAVTVGVTISSILVSTALYFGVSFF
ncbi:MAG: COG2426 family protein [Salibacteraceae bacterium]